VAVFTNLTPEHSESHGGVENYKNAKGELFAKLSKDRPKKLGGKDVKKISVVNLNDPHSEYFLAFEANKKFGFLVERTGAVSSQKSDVRKVEWPLAMVKAMNVELSPSGSRFTVRDVPFRLRLPGMFNVENAMAAVAVGLSQGIDLRVMASALEKVPGVPGRLESIDAGQSFGALVDYAPEPASLGKLYEVVKMMNVKGRIIHILGSTGGGRDVSRRPVLGEMAAKNADIVIVTNEDSYDDDPMRIVQDVAEGSRKAGKTPDKDLFTILDRGEAIEKAVSLAGPGDLVIITGKGAEQAMCVAGGKKLPWDDRVKLREAIAKKLKEKR
jgi:UDP-N-acetylmuramoyl-L-alanyl-D-glutamate--2,6-diaminopimelate ligase